MRTDELDLRPGDLVEVRGAAEIIATLDADGALDGLPFMPEMLPYCGQRFRVYRRAHKTCDTITWSGLRGMDRTVHLEATRCDGQAHGGCQAGCLLFWKEAWLRPVDDGQAGFDQTSRPVADDQIDRDCEAWLKDRARIADNPPRFRCQATELLKATCPLSALSPSQYLRDVYVNGATVSELLHALAISVLNRLLRAMRRATIPLVIGELRRTPHAAIGLEPGELVEVKSHAEILATLDQAGKNRGLSFDAEMVPYCGQRFRVLRRVDAIVDEKTGELRSLPGPCLILDGVVCRGHYHRLCPRASYPYWREIWLRRVEAGK